MANNLPAVDPDENDKHCAYRDEDGNQCKAFHTKESPYCYLHAGNAAKLIEARSKATKRRKELQEDLEFNFHELQSVEGIAAFYEKIANAVIAGFLKRDKAGLLMMMLPQMYKIAKERKDGGKQQGFFSVRVSPGEDPKITAVFTGENLDRFLLAGEHVAVQMLEDLQKTGNVKVEKRKDKENVIDVEAVDVPKPEELKVPAKELAQLSKKTSMPMKAAQVIDLLGETFGDSEGLGYMQPKPEKEKPPEPVPHKWTGKYEPHGATAELWFYCDYCGARSPNVNKNICPEAPKAPLQPTSQATESDS